MWRKSICADWQRLRLQSVKRVGQTKEMSGRPCLSHLGTSALLAVPALETAKNASNHVLKSERKSIKTNTNCKSLDSRDSIGQKTV